MKASICTRHRFHPDIICRAVWMYFRLNLSFRDVEELMTERCVDVSYETIQRWVETFGSQYAKRIKSRSENPSPVWHLDEAYTKINGKMVYLWRDVDDEGTVLDLVIQRRRNTKAARRILRKLLKNPGIRPIKIVTDRLGSYGAALNYWVWNTCKPLEAERTIVPNVLTFQYEGENENPRNLDRRITHRNHFPLMIKSIISSIIDAILSQETRSEI